MMAAAWGLGSVSADGREAEVEERPVVGSANCLEVIRARLGSLQGRRGRGHPPCLPGINSPNAKTHHPEALVAATATAAGSEALGPARPWLGGWADGLTVVARP